MVISLLRLLDLYWFKISIFVKVWKSQSISKVYLGRTRVSLEKFLAWFPHTNNILVFKIQLIRALLFNSTLIAMKTLFIISFLDLFKLIINLIVMLVKSVRFSRHEFLGINKIILEGRMRWLKVLIDYYRVRHHDTAYHIHIIPFFPLIFLFLFIWSIIFACVVLIVWLLINMKLSTIESFNWSRWVSILILSHWHIFLNFRQKVTVLSLFISKEN